MMFYIFIYIFMVGCSDGLTCSDCYLEIEAPSLELNEDGYYTMNHLSQDIQTFTTLNANTGSISEHQKIEWIANREIYINGYWTNLVNQSSYTDNDGVAHTVLSVWEQFIGDTVKIYAGYTDDCNIHHLDSLEVIVN